MILLTKEQITYLLEELSFETVIQPDKKWSSDLRVQKRVFGYREGVPGTIQAALSIGLELKSMKEKFVPGE